MPALQSLIGGGSHSVSKPSTLSQMLGPLAQSLFSVGRSRLPGSAPGDHRPHVKEGLAPPPMAVSTHHWLRLAETRMSTGMREARGRALCSRRYAGAFPAFQRDVGRGRQAGGRAWVLRCSGASLEGPWMALYPLRVSEGSRRVVRGRVGWTQEGRRLHVDFDAKPRASVQLCAKNPTLECAAPFPLDLAMLYPCTCPGEEG